MASADAKESFYIRKDFLVHQHGRPFIVLEHQSCENTLFEVWIRDLSILLLILIFDSTIDLWLLQDEKTTSIEKKVKELTDEQGRLQKTNHGLQVFTSLKF